MTQPGPTDVHRTTELQKTKDLIDQVLQPHRRISPCFMTGKGCVYTEQIDRELEKRHTVAHEIHAEIARCLSVAASPSPDAGSRALASDCPGMRAAKASREQRPITGFTIIPFKPNFLTFYQLCLQRYVEGYYCQQVTLEKADSVRKTGYVICEKICRKIQEADFVIADISVPNPNVFYELGLAYGSQQKIYLVANNSPDGAHRSKAPKTAQGSKDEDGSKFAQQVRTYFSNPPVLEYENLNMLHQGNFDLSAKLWKPAKREDPLECKTLLLIEDSSVASIPLAGRSEQPPSTQKHDDIDIDFVTHVKAALGVAIVNIEEQVGRNSGDPVIPEIYREWISKLRGDDKEDDHEGIKVAQSSNRFPDVLDSVNNAFCVVIRTGRDCHPLMYFWLGYCHARGKNVIPITEANTAPTQEDAELRMSDLAFDIRALWHIVFDTFRPEKLEEALQETLYQMILNDYSEWSRKRFWDEILEKRGKVSIFTGALHNGAIGREMIGDWDLRAVSELTSYFASHQYRATIESPVYHPQGLTMDRAAYIDSLKDMLRDKNCVIIASPDVNPLTEIVLCQAYGLPQNKWFGQDPRFAAENENNSAVVAFKQVVDRKATDAQPPAKLTFYREVPVVDDKRESPPSGKPVPREDTQPKTPSLKRGFLTRFFPAPNFRLEGTFVDQRSGDHERFDVHAHLAVVPNPFSSPNSRTFIVLLNGVSGPATFALTHVLTGGVSNEFVSYQASESPNSAASSSGTLAPAKPFDPKSESEKVMKSLLATFIGRPKDTPQRVVGSSQGCQCIIHVTVGQAEKKRALPFDWRHILRWELPATDEKPFIGLFPIAFENR